MAPHAGSDRDAATTIAGKAYHLGMLWLLATWLLLLGLSWLGRRHLTGSVLHSHQEDSDSRIESEPPLPIGDELDLHGIPPREVAALVDAFIDAAHPPTGSVQIVHGKGIGSLRQLVRSRLARHPRVVSFGDAPPPRSWGATVVELAPLPDVERSPTSD